MKLKDYLEINEPLSRIITHVLEQKYFRNIFRFGKSVERSVWWFAWSFVQIKNFYQMGIFSSCELNSCFSDYTHEQGGIFSGIKSVGQSLYLRPPNDLTLIMIIKMLLIYTIIMLSHYFVFGTKVGHGTLTTGKNTKVWSHWQWLSWWWKMCEMLKFHSCVSVVSSILSMK